ncbi:hypothetical protein HDU97_001484 [Phlyctochytrium planicorne]|nr:hypothetical protein HDU97_001484 [Phlyctochytrium planicorne]
MLQSILIHLAPSSTSSTSNPTSPHLNTSGIRMMLRFSSASTELKNTIDSLDPVWKIHWEAMFDPCYDGMVQFPRIHDRPAKLEPRTLPARVYLKRMKERMWALDVLARVDAVEKGEDVGHAVTVVADMCRESAFPAVSKNRQVVGDMLNIETFFMFFEKRFDEHRRVMEWDVGSSVDNTRDFFQVLAYCISYGSNINKADELFSRSLGNQYKL